MMANSSNQNLSFMGTSLKLLSNAVLNINLLNSLNPSNEYLNIGSQVTQVLFQLNL